MAGRGRNGGKVNENCGEERVNMAGQDQSRTTISDAARMKVLFTLLASVAALLLAGNALAAAPTITSDQADYSPGSTVTLTGAGWGVGESVHIFVNDDQNQSWSVTHDAVAGLDGSFVGQVTLPTYFVAVYTATATGATSGSASTTFTDGNLSFNAAAPAPSSWAISYTKFSGSNQSPNTTCSGAGAPGSLVMSGTTAQNLQGGIGQNDSVRLGSVTTAEAYAFDNWTNASNTNVSSSACIAGSSGNVADLTAHFHSTAPVKQNQTISFTSTAPAAAFGSTYTPTATATSGLSVAFGASGACSFSGGTVTMNSVGTCTVTADQAGNASFNPAPQVTQVFAVGKANQSITFASTAPSSAVVGSSYQPQATGGASGNAVTFGASGACSYNGSTGVVTMASVGTCTVTADQLGNANYDDAPQATQNFAVGKANQTVAVTTAAPTSAAFNASFTVGATATSGLALVYSSSGSCSNVGARFTMTSGTGTCTVKYDQPGDANYNAAPQVTESVTASKLAQSITFAALADKTFGDAAVTVSATGGASGSPVTFTASGQCTGGGTNGATITITGAGSCTVTADQAGNANYDAAPAVQQSFQIAKKGVAITPQPGQSKVYGTAEPTLSFTNDGGLAASAFTGALGRVAGSAVGQYAITIGDLSAGGNYTLSLSTPAVTFSITAKSITVVADDKTKAYGSAEPTLTVTVPAGALESGDSLSGDLVRAAGSNVGSYAITQGTLTAGPNYDLTVTPGTLTITAKSVTVTADDESKVYGSADPAFTHDVSGLESGDSLAGVSCDAVAHHDVGSYAITCSGNTNGNYDASYVAGTLTITKKPITGDFITVGKVYDGNTDAAATGRSLNGVVGNDAVALTGGTASFDTKNVGSSKTVTLSGATLTGADAGNYSLTSVGTQTADITKKSVTGSFTANSKVYDGSTAATISGRSLSGKVADDAVSLSGGTAAFADKNVGVGKVVTATGFTLSGTDAGNYVLDAGPWTTSADITPKQITGSFTAQSKIYDGTSAATILTRSLAANVPDDAVTLAGGTATFDNSSVGLDKTVTATGFTLAGADAGNYTLAAGPWTTKANITYGWNGFLQPINDTAHQTGVAESKFKLGQTVPAKFVLRNAQGGVVQQTGNPTFTRSTNRGSCDATTQLETQVETVTPDPAAVFTWDGSQYHYNWSTKGLAAGEYRIYANLADGTKPYVDICLS